MQRRLTTIVAADVAGYSRLIGLDEEGTLAALRGHREALIDPLLEQHGGRVANTAGDSLLIEFPSAVEAVRCAITVQEGMAGRNTDVPQDRRIDFRVGINVGDVVDQDGDLLGDGVNIAARLEAQAPPGGIVLSRAARDQIRDRLDVDLADLGEIEVKNIARPVRAFQVAGDGEVAVASPKPRLRWPVITAVAVVLVALLAGGAYWWIERPEFTPADPAKMAYPLEDRPSIAVLAFDNLTGDPEQEHVSDGISEDIISALARLPGIDVISRSSSFAFKGQTHDIREIAQELSVKYLLEGSVQQSDALIRVSAQLIDAIHGHHVWSRKYDRPRADFFEMRDEITFEIVSALSSNLIEGVNSQKGVDRFDPMDNWLIGRKSLWHYNRWTSADNQISNDLARELIALEPESEWAHSRLSLGLASRVRIKWAEAPDSELSEAEAHAQTAINLNGSSPRGYLALSWVRITQNRVSDAIRLGEMALERAPSDGTIMAILALYYQKDMQTERAIELFERAIRLNSRAPGWIWENYGETLVLAGRYAEAIPIYLNGLKFGAKGFMANEIHLGLAVSYDATGESELAKNSIVAAKKAFPKSSVAFMRDFQRWKDQDYKDRWLATLARLGLPEE